MNQEKKNSIKIDGVTVLCILGILVLIFIAVTPPMLRFLMPDPNAGPNQGQTPTVTDKPETPAMNGTLVCTKEADMMGIPTTYLEKYYYTNGIVVKTEIEETKLAAATATKESLALSCNQSITEISDIEGLHIYCDSETMESGVKKTQVINYADLDIYMLDNITTNFVLEFKINSLMTLVKETKETNGYTCNIES